MDTLLGGPFRDALPLFGQSDQMGTPHVEVGDRYHYVVCERGTEFRRQSTGTLDQLLFWIARDKTVFIAGERELKTRRSGEDSRRQLFRTWVDLMALLDDGWAGALRAEITATLDQHPFNDDLG